MYKTISLILIFSITLTGCCSMISDPTRRVTVTAQQSDANVFVDGYACGTAPLLVDLDKKYDHTIVVSKTGYQPQQVVLKSRRTMRSASNLLTPVAGAAIGTGIGLACYGTSGYIIPFALVGTGIGAVVGLGVGVIGTATDISLRSDCDLNAHNVHFDLIQAN